MRSMKRCSGLAQIAACFFLALLLATTFGCDSGTAPGGCNGGVNPSTDLLPVVFVHGMAGSADQFSLQAQRFASNGYPADYISGFEYDTTLASNTVAEVMTALDAHIDAVLAKTGAKQVDLAGHSMGTMMSQRYLSVSSRRAAKVAHYVNIDGMTRDALPGGVPTLAIWASLDGEGREITGATNVTLPGQTHVQSCTSAETFAEMYKFFNGEEPETVDVLSENTSTITLAGKMTTFLTNAIPQDYSLDIYEVDAQTGQREGSPVHTAAIEADGSFEFADAKANTTYEFATHSTDDPNLTQHFYYEPEIRSNFLMRLKVAEPGSVLTEKIEYSDNQSNLTIVRDKELVGNAEYRPNETLLRNDSLTVNGIELCSKGSTPIIDSTIGLEVFDAGTDGKSDVTRRIQSFVTIPFITGLDLFIQASTASSPQGSIAVELNGRQNGGVTQMIHVPNWSSTTHKVTVQFRAL